MMVTVAIGLAVLGGLQAVVLAFGPSGIWWAALLGGLVLLAAGAVAGVISVVVKWLVVGRIKASEYPLWSSFVWRNELADTFVETVAAPWFARAAGGTPVLNMWLRGLGPTSAAGCGVKVTGCRRRTW
ncbi:putative non-ribosomal peptide synthetase [Mycobacterium ulcerans str. Harvey]|uniref:Non-ribosomal peptide synthetase n=1 Tax=Mycobacterium ulcerans str. Harvey TaxID=1299332 RepID=A0ABN0QPE6_MYCUL|nr:putative non-ribosomal peptide synthetase [Mycobacterium ulcerans str. Harvey]